MILFGSWNQDLQCRDVPAIVAGFIDWCLCYERRISEPSIIQQTAERLNSDDSLSDVLMPVQL